jgi:hypothetical protein
VTSFVYLLNEKINEKITMEKRSIKAEFEQEKDKKRISSTKRTELFQIKNIQHYDRKVCISPVQMETAARQRRNTVTTKIS